MRKCVNGKLFDMTEEDIAKAKARASRLNRTQTETSSYENRIKELEATVAALLNKLETTADDVTEETTKVE